MTPNTKTSELFSPGQSDPHSQVAFVIDKQVTINAINLLEDDIITFELLLVKPGSMPDVKGCCIKAGDLPVVEASSELLCSVCDDEGIPIPVRLDAEHPRIVLDSPQGLPIRARFTGPGLGIATVLITPNSEVEDITDADRGCAVPCCKPDPESWQETGPRRCADDGETVEALMVDNCGNEEWQAVGDQLWSDTGLVRCVPPSEAEPGGGTEVQQVNECGGLRWVPGPSQTWEDTGETRCTLPTPQNPDGTSEIKQVNDCGQTRWVPGPTPTWTDTGSVRCTPATEQEPDGGTEVQQVNDCGQTRWIAGPAQDWQDTGERRCLPPSEAEQEGSTEIKQINDCGQTRWVPGPPPVWEDTGEVRCFPASEAEPDGSTEVQQSNGCGDTRWVDGGPPTWTRTGVFRCEGDDDGVMAQEVNPCGDFRWVASGEQTWRDTGNLRSVFGSTTLTEKEQINECGQTRWVPGPAQDWQPDNEGGPNGDGRRCRNNKIEIHEVNQTGNTRWRATSEDCGWVPSYHLPCGGLAYRPGDYRDPDATVALRDCDDNSVIAYIYPTARPGAATPVQAGCPGLGGCVGKEGDILGFAVDGGDISRACGPALPVQLSGFPVIAMNVFTRSNRWYILWSNGQVTQLET